MGVQEKIEQKPFRSTHVRDDGLQAMLLAVRDGTALYRVRYSEGGRVITSTVSASERHFRETFQ